MCIDDLIALDKMRDLEFLTIGTINICISFLPGLNTNLKPIIFFLGIFFILFFTFSLAYKYKYGYWESYIKKFSMEIERMDNINNEFMIKVVGKSARRLYIDKLLLKTKIEKIFKILLLMILSGIIFILDINDWYVTLFIIYLVQALISNIFSFITIYKYGEIYSYKLIKEALEVNKKNDELELKVQGEAANIVMKVISFVSAALLVLSYFFGTKLLIIGMVIYCFMDIITWCVKKILLRNYYK